jgi:hypothetical protein
VTRGEPLTPRHERVFVAVCTILLVVVAALSTWGVMDPGRHRRPGHGCVSVTGPSSTGGAILHDCGDAARALCRRAFAQHDRIALLTRPECRRAGLGPS